MFFPDRFSVYLNECIDFLFHQYNYQKNLKENAYQFYLDKIVARRELASLLPITAESNKILFPQ
jgi:hypothetical protein